MIFSEKTQNLLTKMKIDCTSYSNSLEAEFDEAATIFNKVMEYFDCKNKINGPDTFIKFWSQNKSSDYETKIFNWAYELYNNLDRFFSGGVLNLYMSKQAEWGAPKVTITREDVPYSDIHLLDVKQKIYRGLCHEEYSSKEYGQSWTLDINTAILFANGTYSDKPSGIVAQAVVNRNSILYFDKNNGEHEVIIEVGAVRDAHIVKV